MIDPQAYAQSQPPGRNPTLNPGSEQPPEEEEAPNWNGVPIDDLSTWCENELIDSDEESEQDVSENWEVIEDKPQTILEEKSAVTKVLEEIIEMGQAGSSSQPVRAPEMAKTPNAKVVLTPKTKSAPGPKSRMAASS